MVLDDPAVVVVVTVVVEIGLVREMRIDLRMRMQVDLARESRWLRGDRSCRYVQTEIRKENFDYRILRFFELDFRELRLSETKVVSQGLTVYTRV